MKGAKILDNDEDIIKKSDAILQMNILSDENLNKLKRKSNFNRCS